MPTATLGFNLSAPLDSGAVSLTHSQATALGRLEFAGAATHVIDLAAMPAAGLRGLLIVVEATDADGAAVTAPISIHWTSNSIAKVEELSPGGAFLLASPSPTNGITALSIVATATCVVRVYAMG